jgi:GNAT superfamily N-acetyltransferase
VIIRDAVSADAAAIAVLLDQLGYPGSTAASVSSRIADYAGGAVLVAVLSDRVIGSLSLFSLPLFERPGRLGRVTSLVVDAGVRRSGAGKALLAEAEKRAVSWGCVAMDIASSRHRSAAHAFYRAAGYLDKCETSARFFKDLT